MQSGRINSANRTGEAAYRTSLLRENPHKTRRRRIDCNPRGQLRPSPSP